MMAKPAPVALFVYNRPHHTMRTIAALAQNELAGVTEIYVFADGPREHATAEDLKKIESVRSAVSSVTGFAKVNLFFADSNKGLSASITSGINHVLEKHDRIIVFEDDIVAHPFFLKFCNQALAVYESEEKVFAISGYSFPLKSKLPPSYFLRTGAVWGWACWKRSWNHFTMDTARLIREIEISGRVREFNFDNNYDFFEMLQQHHLGRISSWDVCWYASVFVNNGLTYYPAKSLTVNIGMDGSGTHYKGKALSGAVDVAFSVSDAEFKEIFNHRPESIQVDARVQKAFVRYLSTFEKGGLKNRFRHLIKKYGRIQI